MSGLLDHVMMRVEDLDAALDWYTTHFEYEEKGRWEAETFTNVFLGPAEAHESAALLELTYNHDGRSYEMGDAWGHISVRVRDVRDAYERLVEAGVDGHRSVDETPGPYAFVKDCDGHEIELSQRDHGARWGIDHVMVRTDDPTRTIGWYAHVLDYDLYWRSENEEYALYNLEPTDAPQEAASVQLGYEYEGPFTLGDAWGHLAVRADDLHEYWETLQYRGAEDYRDPASCDDRYAFTKDAEGREIEIVTRG
jgi:lactoylglutathione lyase